MNNTINPPVENFPDNDNLIEKYDKNLDQLTFVAFDLETTGLFPVTSEIIEIGAIKFSFNGEEISRYETLVKPNNPVSHESFLIHNITDDMLKGQPDIKEVLKPFLNFIKDSVLIAHNSMFDMSFISYAMLQDKIEFPDNIALDTRILGRNLVPEAGNYKLSSLTDYFNISHSTFHRAIYDAEYCMKVFLAVTNKFFTSQSLLSEVVKYNKTIDFSVISNTHNLEDIPDLYEPLKDAVTNSKKISIIYKRHNGEILEREITPFGFLRVKNKFYVEAFCHLRGEKRNFKLTKILNINNIDLKAG